MAQTPRLPKLISSASACAGRLPVPALVYHLEGMAHDATLQEANASCPNSSGGSHFSIWLKVVHSNSNVDGMKLSRPTIDTRQNIHRCGPRQNALQHGALETRSPEICQKLSSAAVESWQGLCGTCGGELVLYRAQSAALSSHVSASRHTNCRLEITTTQDIPESDASLGSTLGAHSWKNKTQDFHPFCGVSTDKMTVGRGPRFRRYGVLES